MSFILLTVHRYHFCRCSCCERGLLAEVRLRKGGHLVKWEEDVDAEARAALPAAKEGRNDGGAGRQKALVRTPL